MESCFTCVNVLITRCEAAGRFPYTKFFSGFQINFQNTIATIAALEATPPTDLAAAYRPDPPVVSHQQRGEWLSVLSILAALP